MSIWRDFGGEYSWGSEWHCTPDLLFYLLGLSFFAYDKLETDLLIWSNTNQSNKRSANQQYFPLCNQSNKRSAIQQYFPLCNQSNKRSANQWYFPLCNQSNKRSANQWYFPLCSKWVFSVALAWDLLLVRAPTRCGNFTCPLLSKDSGGRNKNNKFQFSKTRMR